MKRFVSFVITATLFTHCGTGIKTDNAIHINGSYINQAESEFSKAYDTIVISSYDEKAATYLIIRKTGFFRISNGILQPKQYKAEKSIGVLEEEHLQLQEQKKGIIYSFTSSGDELIVDGTRYLKISS